MERDKLIDNDKGFYHIITVIICLGIVLLTSLALLITYLVSLYSDETRSKEYQKDYSYNQVYFSDKIFNGVTVSGLDVGGMTVQEAKEYLSGRVDYDIKIQKLVLKFEDNEWSFDRETLKLTVDVEKAAHLAYDMGRTGGTQEQESVRQKLQSGEKIDISAIIIEDSDALYKGLMKIKEEIDIKRVNATVTFKFENNQPVFTYTDELAGRSLNLTSTYYDITQLVKTEKETLNYTIVPETVEPEIKRADIEKPYQKCSTFTTELSAYSSSGRIQNITRALEALDNRVWMPGQVFSFNQWVGARTVENGFGLGVFINEDQQYDETIGGGICQVSTTIYYSALLAGANSVGRNAPIEIIERRPHTWPSVYIARGLDATVSWPHTDLKMYNNSKTPYFMNTDIVRKGSKLYVTVEYYGMPLPNNAKVTIETETIEEIQPGTPEYIVDTKNKYNLQLNQEKQVSEARTGYTVNIYQVWTEQGKEPVKSLLTVSKYEPIKAKIYISPETNALRTQAQPQTQAG